MIIGSKCGETCLLYFLYPAHLRPSYRRSTRRSLFIFCVALEASLRNVGYGCAVVSALPPSRELAALMSPDLLSFHTVLILFFAFMGARAALSGEIRYRYTTLPPPLLVASAVFCFFYFAYIYF